MEVKYRQKITEAAYLTADNSDRYQAILHYFYVQHERLRHYLYPEEILQHLKQSPYFSSYTEEKLEQDLNQLVNWKNLIARQETGRATSVEMFKRKRYRYQCTPYTVEIERMVQKLEKLGESFGGSLESPLFDRLLEHLIALTKVEENPYAREGESRFSYEALAMEGKELNRLWEEWHGTFRRIVEDASGYIAHLHSEKVEERMMTDAFIVYKDRFTDYLRYFVLDLQQSSAKIQGILQAVQNPWLEQVVARLVKYQESIPRLDESFEGEEIRESYLDQWQSLKDWFLGHGGGAPEVNRLQDITNGAIRRIARVVQRMGEKNATLQSRKKDYLYLAQWFRRLDSPEECHRLSSVVFGAFHTRHLQVNEPGGEDLNRYIWEEGAEEVQLKPRERTYREKSKPGAVTDRSQEKEALRQQYLQQMKYEKEKIESFIENGRLEIGNLPVVEPFVRKTLLHWIGKCMANEERISRTETGRTIQLVRVDDHRILLRAEDGQLELPNFVIRFLA